MAAVGGVGCGLITASAIAAVFGSLGEYQVHDFADQDGVVGLAGGLMATVVAVLVIGILHPADRKHVLVPLVMVPAAVVPLVAGGERNRLEAALVWGAAAFAVHLSFTYGHSWRIWTAAALVLPCAAALITWGCQHRWRAQKFEAVGLPLVVPEIPGFRLTGSWAGRYSVSMALRGPSDRWVYAVIERSAGTCSGPPLFCLRDGAVLKLLPAPESPGIDDLLPLTTVREVSGSVLADQPDNTMMSEPD